MVRVLLVGVLLSAFVLGCSDGSSKPEEHNASDPGVTFATGQEPFVRRCETFVQERKPGRMFVDDPNDVTFGKLTFRSLRGLSDRRNAGTFKTTPELAAKWRAFKVLVTIQGGAGATVSIPTSAQRNFLLLYDPAHFKGRGRRKLAHVKSDGQSAVRFGQCEKRFPRGESQVVGGVLARRPGCYRIRVLVDGTPKPIVRTVNVAMGAKECQLNFGPD